MRLTIIVKLRSSKTDVIQISESEYQVRLTASPVDGEANEQLIKVLSEYFDIAKTHISILKGKTGKKKMVEISK